ncbi:sigma 54-interacting transcriptional regulator [Pendulispora albinea]|uniref:Sigma 54-interacting transcriptional regulator n=1 Tax=Pendulispora albinea TaxID=2741071 RepID=A0ABZ2LSJ7_9BACT
MSVLQLARTDSPSRARALVFEDARSVALLKRLERIAASGIAVLVTGETGTGKEIVARHVHLASARADRPFVAVNCGALSPALMESELFGHEKGAFTGALGAKPGWFEVAHGGTLFLDEVGDLPLGAQVKLLRVLQEREVVRIGARRPIPVDVRVIAATNVGLASAVAEGRFRSDLYYRLDVGHLAISPLRERPGDILPLAKHFLAVYAEQQGLTGAAFSPGAIRHLMAHLWPGNIRELENAIQRALAVCTDAVVTEDDLRSPSAPPSRAAAYPVTSPIAHPAAHRPEASAPAKDAQAALEAALLAWFEEPEPDLYRKIEDTVFRTAYAASDRNQLAAARLLGISRNVVRARLMQQGLLAPSVRSRPGAMRVRIGYQNFGVLARLKSTRGLDPIFAAHDANVEWIECATGMHVVDGLAAGALDLGVVGEAPPVFAQADRAPLVYLASEPPAPEAEAIVVHEPSGIHSLTDLQGRTLALSRGANVVYFVVRALEEAGLSIDDVELRTLAPADAHGAFARKEVDAWAIWNPMLASLRTSMPARVLRDARGLAPNRAFYMGRRDFADAHPEIVDAFLGQVAEVGGDARTIDAEVMASQQHIADTFHRLKFIPRPVRVREAVWMRPRPAAFPARSAGR